MSLTRDRREWDRLAGRDPMFAIASVPGREGQWTPRDFFDSGEAAVAGIFGMLEALEVPAPSRRALDFGCGLGRLTRALSDRVGEVWGVDISRSMVDQAAELNADCDRCRFIVNAHPDLHVLPTDWFDLVLSMVVLQHVSDRDTIRTYIREFVRIADPGGVIVFQLPCRVARRVRFHPRRLPTLLADALPPTRSLLRVHARGSHTLNWVGEREVIDLLQASGAINCLAFDDNRVGSEAVPSRLYVAQKAWPPGQPSPRSP